MHKTWNASFVTGRLQNLHGVAQLGLRTPCRSRAQSQAQQAWRYGVEASTLPLKPSPPYRSGCLDLAELLHRKLALSEERTKHILTAVNRPQAVSSQPLSCSAWPGSWEGDLESYGLEPDDSVPNRSNKGPGKPLTQTLSQESKPGWEDISARVSDEQVQLWSQNIDVLLSVSEGSAQRAGDIVESSPLLLEASALSTFHIFLSEYGVSNGIMDKVFRECPELVLEGSVYTAGCALLFFRSLGWRHADTVNRIVALYPQLLLLQRDVHIDPVLAYLEQQGVVGERLRLLVWEYPRIFSKDYRRQVRKFQFLGQYGLRLPAGK